MPNYRRNFVPGGTFFFTVALLERKPDLLGRWWSLSFAYQTEPSKVDATHLIHDHQSLTLHCALDLDFVKLTI